MALRVLERMQSVIALNFARVRFLVIRRVNLMKLPALSVWCVVYAEHYFRIAENVLQHLIPRICRSCTALAPGRIFRRSCTALNWIFADPAACQYGKLPPLNTP